MNPPEPVVSVVIPTINRPRLVMGAVASALGQSLRDIEVIVVVDGPDEETLQALRAIDDPRVRVLPLRENVGLGGARHAGVDGARGRWVALLDDDDEWLPQKLEVQLATARRSQYRLPIITCRVIARTQHGEAVRPRRCPDRGEILSEYLFCRTHLVAGEGLILPSTILAPRELFRDVCFRFNRERHEGSDWLLRAIQREGVGVEFVATRGPLVLWRCEKTRARISNTNDWRASLDWADARATLLTPRARASFILNRVSREAHGAGDAHAFWMLLGEAFRKGQPTLIGVIAHVITWLVPRRVRISIATVVNAGAPRTGHGRA